MGDQDSGPERHRDTFQVYFRTLPGIGQRHTEMYTTVLKPSASLTANVEKILSDISFGLVDDLNSVSELLVQALTIAENSKKGTKKINLYDFVSKNDVRPVMTGVFHDSGYNVACDSITLVAVKVGEGDPEEGKIIAKDGSEIRGRYPAWRAVIPADETLVHMDAPDMAKMSEVVTRAKINKGIGVALDYGKVYIDSSRIKHVKAYMNAYPEADWYTTDLCVMAKTDDSLFLICGRTVDEKTIIVR